MKNLMLVTAAFFISTVLVVPHIQSAAMPPPYYAINPVTGLCELSVNPGCVTSGTTQCTITIDGSAAIVRASSQTGIPCAIALYKN